MSNPNERCCNDSDESDPRERYQKLGLKQVLPRIHCYPLACKELSLILKEAYNKLPKNLQSIIFQDTLNAFRLLPQMQRQRAVSAAHLLLQSAEAALPKQKKNLAVTEFKHAMVAHKRCGKANLVEEGIAELPEDVLVHTFSFLDVQSLIYAGQVCWSWNFATSNNLLWQSKYALCFGGSHNSSKIKEEQNCWVGKDQGFTLLQEKMIMGTSIDWRDAFKKAYIGSKKRLTFNRGYCGQCKAIVWLDNMKCCDGDHGLQCEHQQIMPISTQQVIEYLLDGPLSIIYDSDSDIESDEEVSIPRLWAYPRHIGRC